MGSAKSGGPPVPDATTEMAPDVTGRPIELSEPERLTEAFARFDHNGNGVIQQDEFLHVLKMLDGSFTDEEASRMFAASDSNSDGELHYAEFVAWLYTIDPAVTNRILHGERAAAPVVDDLSTNSVD